MGPSHRVPVPEWQCAGCGEPIGGLEALALANSHRVHFETLDCLLRYGERWRGAATHALVATGLAITTARISAYWLPKHGQSLSLVRIR